jgi:hypothetical protein
MEVYWCKDKKYVTPDLTATQATVKQQTRKVKKNGHNLYIYNFSSSPHLYNDLTEHKINCCGSQTIPYGDTRQLQNWDTENERGQLSGKHDWGHHNNGLRWQTSWVHADKYS